MRRCWWDIQTSLLHTAALVWGRVSKSSGLPFFQLSLSFSTQCCFLKSGHTVLPVLEQGLTVTQCLFSLPFLGMPSVINICYLTERKLFFLQIVCGDAERMLQMGAWRYIREGGISEGIPKVVKGWEPWLFLALFHTHPHSSFQGVTKSEIHFCVPGWGIFWAMKGASGLAEMTPGPFSEKDTYGESMMMERCGASATNLVLLH